MKGDGRGGGRKNPFPDSLFSDVECSGKNRILLRKFMGRELERGLWPGVQWRKILRLNSGL